MMDNLDNLIKANNAFEIIKSAFDNEEIGLPKFLDAAHKYNDIIKAGDPSHGGKLIKKVIINKMGKKETTWVKRGDEGNDKENGNKAANEPVKHSHKVLSAFAAETPEAKLKEVINTSTDEKLRKAAHAELDRRNKKEKPQEEKKETAKKKDKVEPKKESTKESKAEKKESEPSIDFKDQSNK
jgi:hypothetical protein